MAYQGNISIQSIYRDSLFNESVTADTNVFTTSIDSENSKMTVYTVQCSFASAGKLALIRTRNGVSTTEYFNGGSNFVANAIYIFTFVVSTDDLTGASSKNELINFQYTATTTCNSLILTSHGGIY